MKANAPYVIVPTHNQLYLAGLSVVLPLVSNRWAVTMAIQPQQSKAEGIYHNFG